MPTDTDFLLTEIMTLEMSSVHVVVFVIFSICHYIYIKVHTIVHTGPIEVPRRPIPLFIS
jgi:hypothetical protein